MYYLAVDIGVAVGRHMLGRVQDGQIKYEEIHRFPTGIAKSQVSQEYERMAHEIIKGLKKCAELKKIPKSVGITAWGMDFVLLNNRMEVIPQTVYHRNVPQGIDKKVSQIISEGDLYARTGILNTPGSTIYQLAAVKDSLKDAAVLLMLPDFLHYRLCGVAASEYTIATTAGMVNVKTRGWDEDIISALGYPRGIFRKILPSGTVLGELTPGVQKAVGFNCKVVLPASHDNASAVMSIESPANTMYINSGTWSLMGAVRSVPDCTPGSLSAKLSGIGGHAWSYLYQKSIMGLWMLQRVKKEFDDEFSFTQLSELASLSSNKSVVDVSAAHYLNPPNMISAIQTDCFFTDQTVPLTAGDVAAIIFNSMAVSYRDTAAEIEGLTQKSYSTIYILGTGARANHLNKLTADLLGKKIKAGHVDAAAMGNLRVQC